MSVLSYKSPDLESGGATVEIKIFPPPSVIQLYNDKKEKVPTKKVIGLIDTGASKTAIDKNIASELNLIARDKQKVLTPSGDSEHYLYDIVIVLENIKYLIPLQVFGAVLDKQPYDVLLGRDILRYCTLIYNGWNNSYDLHLHGELINY
ncbi:MAG: retroviral-like aspartic protease [Ignavibacteria bacterium]|nr:retroviral-like aspartic protease [Ignavibacteria bacterium]